MKINSDAIRILLDKRGYDIKELAESLEYKYQTVGVILYRGSTKNSTARKIAEFLNCSIDEIRKEG